MPYVFTLTDGERATAERALQRAVDPLQRAALEARLRTGKRVGCTVDAGAFVIVRTGYRIDRKGQPRGYGDVHELSGRLCRADAIACLNGLER